jgi:nitrite reductase/ring-hydroxylating ferredoxin subunit
LIRLQAVRELEVGAARVFDIEFEGRREQAFALRHAGGWSVFVNRCPHWLVDLDFGDGRFYDETLHRIYCKTHGALFVPETGHCDFGPCYGEGLVALRFEQLGDDLIVWADAPPEQPTQ